jgi:hypothetical protein
MGINRWNAKRDDCEPGIRRVIELTGAIVYKISAPGIPDLIVSTPWGNGQNFLLECKDAATGKLKPAQQTFFEKWLGQKAIVTNPIDALIVLDTPYEIQSEALLKYELEKSKTKKR